MSTTDTAYTKTAAPAADHIRSELATYRVDHDGVRRGYCQEDETYWDAPLAGAIEPERVLVLNDDQQRLIAEALHHAEDVPHLEYANPRALRLLITDGQEYANPVDELTRTTLRKRRLEAEVRRCNKAIERCEGLVVAELLERGESGAKHAATGATLSLTQKVWAKVVRAGDKPTDDEKAAAGEALIDAGLGDFVKPAFNTNTVSAHFRELYNAHLAEQQALPEHQRRPLPVDHFLPEPLVGFIELTNDPAISVRAAS